MDTGTNHRRRFQVAAVVGIAATAWLLGALSAYLLPWPWGWVSIPVAAALGWWCGSRVLGRM